MPLPKTAWPLEWLLSEKIGEMGVADHDLPPARTPVNSWLLPDRVVCLQVADSSTASRPVIGLSPKRDQLICHVAT